MLQLHTLAVPRCSIQTLADLEKKKKSIFSCGDKVHPWIVDQVDGPEKPLVRNVSHHLRGVPYTLED